jgi:hypothetical protein
VPVLKEADRVLSGYDLNFVMDVAFIETDLDAHPKIELWALSRSE